jgi:glycosyltransferase involved in cell wall biosynthesis
MTLGRPFLTVARHVLYDFSYHPWFRAAMGWAMAAAGVIVLPFARRRGVDFLLWAHRSHLFVQSPGGSTSLQRLIERWIRLAASKGTFQQAYPPARPLSSHEERVLNARGIVLKAPSRRDGVVERGVLIVKFTEQFWVLRRALDIRRLQEDYWLVLEPSMSGYADPGVLGFASIGGRPVFVQASEERDRVFLERLGAGLVPVAVGSGNWVNPALFHPLPNEPRRFEAVMVAGWRMMKRHHALLRAVSRLRDPGFRVGLVGDQWDRRPIEDLVEYYGLQAQVTLVQGLRAAEVNAYYATSCVNVLSSRREGSNKSIFEGFFADTPGLALDSVIGPAREYFNEHTGLLLPERDWPDALREFQRGTIRRTPREWALANISPLQSTRVLNDTIRAVALARGEPWTVDIVPKENHPEVHYLNAGDGEELPAMSTIMTDYRRAS